MKSLGIVVADAKEWNAIGKSLPPENLIHCQLPGKVSSVNLLVETLDTDD
jgi:hypothetical protein